MTVTAMSRMTIHLRKVASRKRRLAESTTMNMELEGLCGSRRTVADVETQVVFALAGLPSLPADTSMVSSGVEGRQGTLTSAGGLMEVVKRESTLADDAHGAEAGYVG